MVALSRDVDLGDVVVYDGRRYVVRGFTRAGSPIRHVVLEDAEVSDTVVAMPIDRVEPEPGQERGADVRTLPHPLSPKKER